MGPTFVSEKSPLRVPISTASRKGVSYLADQAGERRVVLTKFGRPVAVVESAARIDEQAQQVSEATSAVINYFADLAAGRTPFSTTLQEVCHRFGIDADELALRGAGRTAGA